MHTVPSQLETATAGQVEPPLVSVVVPTRDRPELLGRALASLRRQTHSNLEIIVVDDASNEDMAAVIAAAGDRRIRYIRHETNRGGAAARNTGIRASTGQFIAFLDDDDEWEPEKTEVQLKLLGRYDAALCMYSMQGKSVLTSGLGTTVDHEELRHGFDRGGSASALMARADVVRSTMFDEELPKFQDWDLCIRIGQKYSIGCVNRALVRYNDGAHDRISNAVIHLSAIDAERRLKMLSKHREFFGSRWYRRHMCEFLLYGFTRRSDPAAHLRYVARHYGTLNVLKVLLQRVWRAMVWNWGPRLFGRRGQ
jgi:glycosyltransferase involved in cell wall biosynthesis